MRDNHLLTIPVEVMAGAHIIQGVIPQMIAMANRLYCHVSAKCNGVRIVARPGDDPEDLATAWETELRSAGPVKIAMTGRSTPSLTSNGRGGE